jgi:hypothetical protein
LRYELEKVVEFPKEILPGKLYYSEEFKTSRHRCACGCGDVIRLPIDHLHHHITEGPRGPTLRPSVGNWNVCDAHYYITNGEVEVLAKMSPQQIAAGRRFEDQRRELYFKTQDTFGRRLKRVLVNRLSAIKRWILGSRS